MYAGVWVCGCAGAIYLYLSTAYVCRCCVLLHLCVNVYRYVCMSLYLFVYTCGVFCIGTFSTSRWGCWFVRQRGDCYSLNQAMHFVMFWWILAARWWTVFDVCHSGPKRGWKPMYVSFCFGGFSCIVRVTVRCECIWEKSVEDVSRRRGDNFFVLCSYAITPWLILFSFSLFFILGCYFLRDSETLSVSTFSGHVRAPRGTV